MNLYGQTYNQLPLITAPQIHTDLLWDLSFLFIGLATVYFIFVFFYRNRLSKRSWQVKERKRELSPMISEFLFYEEEATKDEKSNYVRLKIEIRQLLKDDFNRRVLSEVLLDLRKDVSGDTQKRLFKLYQDLGLHNTDFKRLKSWRWEVVSKAILNLTQMQVAEAYSFVTKFINDKRHTVRKQAEIAVVTLRPEGIDYFLDTTKYRISEWQQLKLMDVLRNEADYQPPRFKAWLTSTNRDVVLFALRLIKYYNQNDANAALIELVKHKNSQIKEEAIGCIKEFRFVEALPTLKLVFWKCSTDVKISILGAIGALGDDSDIEFLRLIEKKEANFSVRSKAHSSINAIAPDSIMPSKGLVNTAKYTIPADIKTKEEEDVEWEEIYSDADTEIELSNEIIEQTEEIGETKEIEGETSIEVNLLDILVEAQEIPIDNDVKPDVMKENPKPGDQETTDSNVKETDSVENQVLSFDFLPLVVEEVLETETNTSEEDVTISLNDMPVSFEEVTIEEVKSPNEKKPIFEITEEEIAFLPIVTELIEESYEVKKIEDQSEHTAIVNEIEVLFDEVNYTSQSAVEKTNSTYAEYNTPEIRDTLVIYDEIPFTSTESIENEDQTDPYLLSHLTESEPKGTMDSKSNASQQSIQSNDDMDPQDEQKFKKIIKGLIDFDDNLIPKEIHEEFQNGPLLEFGDEFVDTSEASESFSENTTEVAENQSPQDEEKTPTVAKLTIPKAILNEDIIEDVIEYKENTEESRMQLLDDLSEMGDERELPLLNELLVNEKYATVKDRVKKLIEKFSETKERPVEEALLKPFNVFEDLFRTCDTEAKLILMDEIVAVGDEGEIDFLEGLLEGQEVVISNKAAKILEELKKKLSNSNENAKSPTLSSDVNPKLAEINVLIEEETLAEYDSLLEELQIQPSQDSEIFELTFELTEPLEEAPQERPCEENTQTESILGQICAFFKPNH